MTVRGFLNETKPLTDSELAHAEFMGRMFTSGKTTRDNKIKGPDLCDFLKRRFRLKGFAETRLRKCINHLRTNKIAPVVSDNKGYWQATTLKEVDECINSLEDRIAGIQVAIDGLIQMREMFITPPQKPKDGKLF
jgi:hypothetical protein